MDGISRSRGRDKEIPHGVLPIEQLVLSDKWARKSFPVQLQNNNLMFAYAIQNRRGAGGGGLSGTCFLESILKNRCFLATFLVSFLFRKQFLNVTYPTLSH